MASMKREKAISLIDNLIVTLKAVGEPYCTPEDIEALEFARKNLANTSTLKGILIFDKRQCEVSGWKDRVRAIETAQALFDRYLED